MCSFDPVTQATAPGRLMTTAIETCWPAGMRIVGQMSSPLSWTGIGAACGPLVTCTLWTLPPPSGIRTVARARAPATRLALELANAIAAAPSPARTRAAKITA